jgi:hypothetical protein
VPLKTYISGIPFEVVYGFHPAIVTEDVECPA